MQVDQVEGDDGLPFERIPNDVAVVMEGDASEDEIAAVFDELDDDVDSGDVDSILLNLQDEGAVLSVGEGIHADRAVVEDLVAAGQDPHIKSYKRDAHPVLPGVDIELVSGNFDDVRAVVTRYRDVDDIEFVQVVSGRFVYIHDEGNEDVRRTGARAKLVSHIGPDLLTGCIVAGRGPLHLRVDREDEAQLRAFLSKDPAAQTVGVIEIRTQG